MIVVLDQKHQATEQAGHRGQQHQDNRGLEHGATPGECSDVDKYSEAPVRPFRPGWIPTLLVFALLPGLIALGCWQLGRADEKRALLTTYAEREVEPPVATSQLPQTPDPAYRRVRLFGRFDAEHSILLDNSMRDGQAGVELLQPFHDQASGLWLLVNRGWLPWPDRRVPVTFTTPDQALALDATVYVAPGKTFQLHPDPVGGQWPHLLTAVDPATLWQQLDREGFAHELRLEPGAASYRLGWPIVALGPEKHLGYAVQWFALATALVLLYLYFGWHHKKEKPHGRRHSTGPA
nr:SURF1 family protein [Pantoea sp. Ap-967]